MSPIIWNKIPDLAELKNKFPKMTHIFFDLDGTLIDSEEVHMSSIKALLHQHTLQEVALAELYQRYEGKTDLACYHDLCERYHDFKLSAEEFLQVKRDFCLTSMTKLARQNKLLDEKFVSLFKELQAAGIKLALVTAAQRDFMEFALSHFPIDPFELKISANDVKVSKPDPMPYLQAMEYFKITDKSTVLIFEDSLPGLASALAAGAIVNKVRWFHNEDL